jgi:protoheme IX farnesyltransferase
MTKPRITMLLLITCVAAMLCAERGMPSLGILLATALGLALSSGGASALNHVFDRDIDARMARTSLRPVVTGVVSPRAGTIFGLGLMALAGVLLWLTVNPLTAMLALAGGGFYVLGYTMVLKRSTVQNIVIGGAAGAVPPLVGWAAVDGSLGLLAWVLFGIVFLWTPPHFWALALLIKDDYAKAGVPMLPCVVGDKVTARHVWWYTVVLSVSTVIPYFTGDLGAIWLVCAVLLDAWLLTRAHALSVEVNRAPFPSQAVQPGTPAHTAARHMFLASMGWLALVFLAAVLDRLIG